MSPDAIYVLAVLAVTVVLFVSDRIRLELVAILATLALVLGGQIDADAAVAGLGDRVVVLIAALFVVGEALFRTGVAHRVGGLLVARAGTGERRLIALMMLAVAVLSAFMSSTGAVAVFIPIAIGLAQRTGIPRERLLMPLAIAAMIGGMLTLIGTPPNLVVAGELRRAGLEPFGFFAFTPIGAVVLAAGVAYMAFVGVRLLGGRGAAAAADAKPTIRELIAAHDLGDEVCLVRVPESSRLVGRAVREARLIRRYGVTVVGVRRAKGFRAASPETRFEAGDLLLVTGDADAVGRFAAVEGVARVRPEEAPPRQSDDDLGMVEVLVSPLSQVVGRTVVEAGFREVHGLVVQSVQRGGERVRASLAQLRLEGGDVLLLAGSWGAIRRLARERPNLFVLRLPQEADDVAPAQHKAPIALAVTALMIAALTLNLLPSVIVVLIAAVALVLSGCLDMSAAYRAINWQSVLLIAFMLPMATALENSGALTLIVDALVGALADTGPLALLAALFVLTSLLSQMISNTATTVLVAPVALSAAQQLDVSPYALLMGVAIAASTAFATPVASPVNTLVLGPGRYRFTDFLKVGVALQLVALVLCLALLPVLFPF
ncbi:MAG: SLC13 family permease [Alphaproteobacteria bacterium]